MKSLSDNIKMYIQLTNYIQENNNPLAMLSAVIVSSGMNKMVDGYSKLSKSIQTLGNSINGIDVEKLNSLKLLSGTIVLMSTMDSELFGKMMDKIEEKTGIFLKIMETLEPNTSSFKSKLAGLFDGVRGANTQNATTSSDDVVRELQRLNNTMSAVATNTKSMSNYFESIRTNNINIKDRKHT
jgi:prophage DNA circulation protein